MAQTVMHENSEENIITESPKSEIQKFFNESTIFVTGGTGFLGQVLLAKLLRSCHGIKYIYVLVREKRNASASDRFDRLFSKEIREKVESDCPHYKDKIKLIIGDCEKPNLGLSINDVSILEKEVNVVFHVAATVRFDAPLQDATAMNVRCTRDLINIATKMSKLKVFVHVSTAFTHCVGRQIIEEKFYEAPVTATGLISLVEDLDNNTIEKISPKLLEPYPNSYVFTKAVAEDYCKSMCTKLPLVIFRPAIVISTVEEPVAGWINNVYGPTGIVAAAGAGLLRSLHSDGNCVTNVVPCDYVINALIATAWEVGTTWKSEKSIETENNNGICNGINKNEPVQNVICNGDATQNSGDIIEKTSDVHIYNYGSSNLTKPITWKDFMNGNEQFEPEMPFNVAIGAYDFTLNKYRIIHLLYCFLFHCIPAVLFDSFNRMLGKETDMWSRYQKLHKLADVISYFSVRQWDIRNTHIQRMWQKLGAEDRKTFFFNLNELNWQEYFRNHLIGIRLYIVKDPLESIPNARRRRLMLKTVHYFLRSVLIGMLSLMLYAIASFVLKS